MFGQPLKQYTTTGTTPLIYLPEDAPRRTISPGKGYFFVQIVGAQAAFSGSIWERVRALIVTSQVNLNHPALGNEPVSALRRSIEVRPNRAEQLGMSPNLIKLVPATMSNVNISIEFILDRENQLVKLSGLINSDVFMSAISLAPGAVTTARTIGALSQKLLETFIRAEERRPILQFGGDLNIAAGVEEGYYVILGSRDEKNPLPRPLPKLAVHNGFLYADAQQVTQLSYVIIEVRSIEARTRDLNDGSPWEAKIVEAENTASKVGNNPLVKAEQRMSAWEDCLTALQEAQTLLGADPNYIREEANVIIKVAYAECYSRAFGVLPARGSVVLQDVERAIEVAPHCDRLGIPPGEDIERLLDEYAEQVARSRQILTSANIEV
jgi:hypothetical protein